MRAEIGTSLETVSSEKDRKFRDKHGNVTTMSAGAIGPRKQPLSKLLPPSHHAYAKPVRHGIKKDEKEAGWMAPNGIEGKRSHTGNLTKPDLKYQAKRFLRWRRKRWQRKLPMKW
jgi:hypothetical protein